MLTNWQCFFGRLCSQRGDEQWRRKPAERGGGTYRLSAVESVPHRADTGSRWLHERAG